MDFIFDPSLVFAVDLAKHDGASFMSDDAHGHLCSVTGALWRLDGHYFDGTDDVISAANHSSLIMGTSDFTLLVWFYSTVTGLGALVGKGSGSSGADVWLDGFLVGAHTAGRIYIEVPSDIIGNVTVGHSNDAWNMLGCVFNYQVDVALYLNGAYVDAGDATTQTAMEATVDLGIGNDHYGHAANWQYPFKERVGEVWIYNRALTPQEVLHNYLATKWRYR